MALNWFSRRCSNDFITTDVRATGLHSLTHVVLVLDGRGWQRRWSKRWEKRERNPLAARANSPGLQSFTPESHGRFLIVGPHTSALSFFFLCFPWFPFRYSSTRVLPHHRPGNFKVETACKIHIFPPNCCCYSSAWRFEWRLWIICSLLLCGGQQMQSAWTICC